MNYLNHTYSKLRNAGLVNGLNDFSTRYLLRCESYARSYKSRNKDLTLPVLIVLTARVDKTARALLGTNAGHMLGEELAELATDLSRAVYDKALSS